jgi:hypothetical protein
MKEGRSSRREAERKLKKGDSVASDLLRCSLSWVDMFLSASHTHSLTHSLGSIDLLRSAFLLFILYSHHTTNTLASTMVNPRVFLDIDIDGHRIGRHVSYCRASGNIQNRTLSMNCFQNFVAVKTKESSQRATRSYRKEG